MRMLLTDWQTAGLCLAAVCVGVTKGLGSLFGAAVLAPVVYALVQLRAHAPAATSTASLVAATFGFQVGAFARALQVIGYTLLTVAAAQGVGSGVFALAEQDDHSGHRLWPLAAAAAVVLAALVVGMLPDGALAAVAGLLALTGVLIYSYLGVAVAGHAPGTTPVMNSSTPYAPAESSGWETFAELAQLGLALVAFELVTARMTRVRSLGRPVGVAVALVVLVAAVGWYACDLGGVGSLGGERFPRLVHELYGPSGDTWLLVAGIALFAAGLLALVRGTMAVLGRGRGVTVFVALATVVALGLSLLHATPVTVAEFVLVALYIVVLIASCRIPGGEFVTWWLRALTPVALLAVVLVPPVVTLNVVALVPVAIAVWLVAIAAIASLVGSGR